VGVIGADERLVFDGASAPTPASTWYAASGGPITDRLLEWPPDVFALTNVVLARAEAFRFALSRQDWPPNRFGDWAREVEDAGRRWSAWAEARTGALPDLVAAEWSVFRERLEAPLEQLAAGGDDRGCDALLTLHAIADEACAGLGVALDTGATSGETAKDRSRFETRPGPQKPAGRSTTARPPGRCRSAADQPLLRRPPEPPRRAFRRRWRRPPLARTAGDPVLPIGPAPSAAGTRCASGEERDWRVSGRCAPHSCDGPALGLMM
jgi:hypothetical protein